MLQNPTSPVTKEKSGQNVIISVEIANKSSDNEILLKIIEKSIGIPFSFNFGRQKFLSSIAKFHKYIIDIIESCQNTILSINKSSHISNKPESPSICNEFFAISCFHTKIASNKQTKNQFPNPHQFVFVYMTTITYYLITYLSHTQFVTVQLILE